MDKNKNKKYRYFLSLISWALLGKTKMSNTNHHDENTGHDKSHKIDSLREMINNAEKTIQSAKAMLLQLEGKKKTGRKRKVENDGDEGTIIEGTFDGQIMLGTDGKQYPVPANYASKSKLVEGDMLKLTITTDGSFVYKQIGPIERKHALGIVSQDEKGNYFIFSEGKPYKVLLASITYFKAQPGDEVALMIPRDLECSWAAIENVLQKGGNFSAPRATTKEDKLWQDDFRQDDVISPKDTPNKEVPAKQELSDEWASEIDALEKEIRAQQL